MKPIIAISSCILGNKVRYDGGDTHEVWVSAKLATYFELKAICPEMEMGLGAPRETMNLIDSNFENEGQRNIRLITTKTKQDLTGLAIDSIDKIILRDGTGVCGHIFQQRSPSCGVEQVKLYNSKDELIITTNNNQGLYAKEFIKRFPFVPVIESLKLSNIRERENFLCRVMAYYRFNSLQASIPILQDFHKRYKLILMDHSESMTNQLNLIVDNDKENDCLSVFENYKKLFFETLALLPINKIQDCHFLKDQYHFDPFPIELSEK
ncbi:MAG: DUF523 and DUF1722 domain-containing protein [Bacteriovorax sp.]|nr:DUF523 and DUF1722 domain-containing protein [Bacteriovorax sp.]